MATATGSHPRPSAHLGDSRARERARQRVWRWRRAVVVLLAALVVPVAAGGAGWTIQPSVTVREIYTDNFELAPKGQEASDFTTEVSSGFSLRRRGDRGRVNANLDYRVQAFLTGGGDTDRESINHQLQGNLDAEVVRQRVFVDARATVSQQGISNRGRVSDSNVSGSGNRTTTRTFTISPYAVHHFGRYADAVVRTTFDTVLNDDVASADSSSKSFNVNISSGRQFARMPWGVDFERQTIDNDGRSESEFRRIEGQLRYIVNRKISVGQTVGRDRNDFATSRSSLDGFRWRTNVILTPNPRTSADIGYGGQFSGSSLSFFITHRRRRTIFAASLSEDTSTSRQVQLTRVLVPLTDTFGAPITDPGTGAPILSPTDLPSLTDDVFVDRTFNTSAAYQGRRTSASLRVFNTMREFQLSGDEETVLGVSANVSRRMSRRTSGSITGSWQQSEFAEGDRDDQRWDIGLAFSRQLTRDVSISADYRHIEQTSDLPADEFKENRISMRVNFLF